MITSINTNKYWYIYTNIFEYTVRRQLSSTTVQMSNLKWQKLNNATENHYHTCLQIRTHWDFVVQYSSCQVERNCTILVVHFKAASLPLNKQAFFQHVSPPWPKEPLGVRCVWTEVQHTQSVGRSRVVVGPLPLCKHINLLVPWRWEPAALIDCRKIRGQGPSNISINKLDPSNESNQPRG